jgi:hypothetical protein
MQRLHRWDHVYDTTETNGFVLELALKCASQIIDSDLRQEMCDLLDRRDYLGLCTYEVDYARKNRGGSELSALDFLAMRQCLAFFQKREDLEIGIDKRLAAKRMFLHAESECVQTNDIFRKHAAGSFQFDPAVESQLFVAQRKIAKLLGDVPSLSSIKFRFGPGATTQLTKRTASARRKLGTTFACSEDLISMLPEVLGEMPSWVFPDLSFGPQPDKATVPVEIHAGVVNFVPKNAKTMRSVVVEPSLNTMCQVGIGDYIASRLRSVGINIRDQSRNQHAAFVGSVSGGLATLDLSNASDTIARELVYHLLPIDWALFLDRFRTSHVVLDGETIKQQKFSSMGNGFTFPLETLIFWALSVAVCTHDEQNDVSVYGDDIIVPSHRYNALVKLLACCGFKINDRKSFSSGPFRESCGKDYFSGTLIRPFYLRERLSGESLFCMHNFFVRSDQPELAKLVLDQIDPVVRIWGPDGYGDGHLLGDYERTPCRRQLPVDPRISGGWGGYTFDTFTWKGRKDYRPYTGDYVYPSYCIYLGTSGIEFDDAPIHISRLNEGYDPIVLRRLNEMFGLYSPYKEAFIKARGGCISYDKQGRLGVSLPGKASYKRIKIYTF